MKKKLPLYIIITQVLLIIYFSIAKSHVPEKWDNNEVYFFIDGSLTNHQNVIDIIYSIIADIESRTNITFIERTEYSTGVVVFISGEDARATVGIIKNPFVRLPMKSNPNLFDRSLRRIIYHETFHVLGLHHEHQRPDRNKFIRMNYGNIKKLHLMEFKIHGSYKYLYDLKKFPYDTKSIMHYSSYAFTKNGNPVFYSRTKGLIKLKYRPNAMDWVKLNSIYN